MNKTTKIIRLKRTNFLESIFDNYGYFCEHIPPCFNTKNFGKFLNLKYDSIHCCYSANDAITFPLEITIAKDGLLRREIYIPHIVSYIEVIKYIENNFELIFDRIKNKHSESKANILVPFDYHSFYRKSIKNRNTWFSGAKYKLKLDISNCFNSIYTHSIAWAFLKKEKAKLMHANKITKSPIYNIADGLDYRIRMMKGNETNGILTGPYTSRLISELIFAACDKDLEHIGLNFTRYVDDYNFYFNTETELKNSLSNIANILNRFNFRINENKIKIEKFPFDTIDNLEESFNDIFSISNNPVYAILQEASKLVMDGKKGAFKYAFKYLYKKKIDKMDDKVLVFSYIVSIVVNYPFLSCYAIPLLDKLKVFFDPYDDTKKLNRLLKNEISANHDQEVLWLLFIMIRYESKITVENICDILDGKNDLAIIMVLDIINNHRIYIREYDMKKEEYDRKIEKHIIKLSNALKDEGMYTKRWLLKYEIAYRKFKFNKALKNTNMIKNPVYKIFKSNKIDFYDFPGNPDLVDTSIYI